MSLAARLPLLLNRTSAFTRTKLQKFWVYARVELKPPTPNEIPEISKRVSQILTSAQTGQWKNLTTKQAFLNSVVLVELLFIFFIGEVIGRGSLVGYDVSRVQPKFPLW